MPRPWQRRYTVKQTITGKLVVMVSRYVPDDSPGEWTWGKYVPARLPDLEKVLCKLAELNKE